MKDGAFKVFVRDTIPDKFIAKKSDVIYTRTGQVGAVFRGQLGVIHNNCFTVNTKDETILLQEFIFYMLQEKAFMKRRLVVLRGLLNQICHMVHLIPYRSFYHQ